MLDQKGKKFSCGRKTNPTMEALARLTAWWISQSQQQGARFWTGTHAERRGMGATWAVMECPGVAPFFDIPLLADCSCSRTLLQSSARASPMRHHDRASLSRIFQSYARIDRQGGQPAADAPRRPDLHRCRATHCLARPNLDAQLPVAWADPSGATHRRSWSIGSQERSRIDCNPDPGLA
jgi:hypothetical protein